MLQSKAAWMFCLSGQECDAFRQMGGKFINTPSNEGSCRAHAFKFKLKEQIRVRNHHETRGLKIVAMFLSVLPGRITITPGDVIH